MNLLIVFNVHVLSCRLTNPYNSKIGAPAKGNGESGWAGYITYSDVCWFKNNNVDVTIVYDVETCSPYLFAGEEWISYDNEKSLECKVICKT